MHDTVSNQRFQQSFFFSKMARLFHIQVYFYLPQFFILLFDRETRFPFRDQNWEEIGRERTEGTRKFCFRPRKCTIGSNIFKDFPCNPAAWFSVLRSFFFSIWGIPRFDQLFFFFFISVTKKVVDISKLHCRHDMVIFYVIGIETRGPSARRCQGSLFVCFLFFVVFFFFLRSVIRHLVIGHDGFRNGEGLCNAGPSSHVAVVFFFNTLWVTFGFFGAHN